MKNHHAGPTANTFVLLSATIILLLASATPLIAQRPRNTSRAERNRANQMALNEWSRTHMAEVAEKQFQKRRISLFPQIKEDFTRIQIANNDMMRRVFDEQVLDYKYVSDRLAEIRKRASRLRENLMLPEGENKESGQRLTSALVGGQVKESLLTLDTLIMGFVQNPLFQQPGVIDARLSAKAGHDLKTIIESCGGIKKEVERLSKLQGRP